MAEEKRIRITAEELSELLRTIDPISDEDGEEDSEAIYYDSK